MSDGHILAMNAGSSSIKLSVFLRRDSHREVKP